MIEEKCIIRHWDIYDDRDMSTINFTWTFKMTISCISMYESFIKTDAEFTVSLQKRDELFYI